jgi:hypothetical protein
LLSTGKQRDFFTRSWGVDFVDSAILPSSPHICELPPNSFERYLRKVRKYYSRHNHTKDVHLDRPSSQVGRHSLLIWPVFSQCYGSGLDRDLGRQISCSFEVIDGELSTLIKKFKLFSFHF